MYRHIYIFVFLGLIGNTKTDKLSHIDQYVLEWSEHLEIRKGAFYLKDQVMNGYVLNFYNTPQRRIKSKTSYIQGKKHGMVYKYYPNGKLAEQRLYKSGNKVGLHLGWWPDGTKKFEFRFNGNGNYQGNCLEWFHDGSIFKSFNYVDGHESGHQKMWNSDGSLRANYIIKNKRKYGLQGRKKCISTDAVNLSGELDL